MDQYVKVFNDISRVKAFAECLSKYLFGIFGTRMNFF